MTLETRIAGTLTGLSDRLVLGRFARFSLRYREQILYLVVGGWNTLFGYGVWAMMQFLLQDYLYYLVILVISWPFAVTNAYFCYRHFVFHSKNKVWRELPRFSLVYVITLVAGLVMLPILVHTLPYNLYVIQALFTVVVVVLSYLSHKYFSFRSGGRRPAADEPERSRP